MSEMKKCYMSCEHAGGDKEMYRTSLDLIEVYCTRLGRKVRHGGDCPLTDEPVLKPRDQDKE